MIAKPAARGMNASACRAGNGRDNATTEGVFNRLRHKRACRTTHAVRIDAQAGVVIVSASSAPGAAGMGPCAQPAQPMLVQPRGLVSRP